MKVLGIVALACLAAVTLPNNAATRVYTWPWWMALQVLLVLPAVALLVIGLREGRTACWRWIDAIPFLALAGVQLLAALSSRHVGESIEAALVPIAACLLVLVVAWSIDPATQRVQQWAVGVGIAGLVFGVVSLALWLGLDAIRMIRNVHALNAELGADVAALSPHGFRNNKPLGHSNYTAGVALLFLPWLVALTAVRRGRQQWIWGAGVVLVVLLVFSSGSRGAILGLAGGGAWALLLFALLKRWSWQRLLLIALAGLLAAGMLVFAVPRARQSVLGVVAGRQMSVGDEQRVAMLQIGWEMGRERWWIGQGPGLVPRYYPRYRHQVEGGTDIAYQLHSTPVQLWAETGVPGLLAAILAVGAVMFASVRAIRSPLIPSSAKWFAGAASAAAIGYGCFATTDHQLDLPVVGALVAIGCGVPIGLAARTLGGNFRARWGAVVSIVVLLGWIWVSVPEWKVRQGFAEAVTRLEQTRDYDAFNESVFRVAEWQPENPHLFAGAAAAYLRFGFVATDSAERTRCLAFARAFLEQTLKVEPVNEFALFNLGWLVWDSEPDQATAYFQRGIRLLPDRAGAYLGMGLALLAADEQGQAVTSFALEVINDPAYLASPAWDSELLAPYRTAAADRALEIARESERKASGDMQPRMRYIRGLLEWWLDGERATGEFIARKPDFFSPFREVLREHAEESWDGIPRPETPGWIVLEAALEKDPESRHELLSNFVLLHESRPATEQELAALDAMLQQFGTDWRAWLQSDDARNPPFVRTIRRDRHSYPLLFRNLDLPVAHDAYVAQESTLVDLFFRPLFPNRGFAPDALLLDEVNTLR